MITCSPQLVVTFSPVTKLKKRTPTSTRACAIVIWLWMIQRETPYVHRNAMIMETAPFLFNIDLFCHLFVYCFLVGGV
jgi:hypothetical protein